MSSPVLQQWGGGASGGFRHTEIYLFLKKKTGTFSAYPLFLRVARWKNSYIAIAQYFLVQGGSITKPTRAACLNIEKGHVESHELQPPRSHSTAQGSSATLAGRKKKHPLLRRAPQQLEEYTPQVVSTLALRVRCFFEAIAGQKPPSPLRGLPHTV